MKNQLLMLAGGVVVDTASHADGSQSHGVVSAYVVLSAGHASRLFKVSGPDAAAQITELPTATTIDLKRFERAVGEDLAVVVHGAGPGASITPVSKDWICGLVAAHLKTAEGVEV